MTACADDVKPNFAAAKHISPNAQGDALISNARSLDVQNRAYTIIVLVASASESPSPVEGLDSL